MDKVREAANKLWADLTIAHKAGLSPPPSWSTRAADVIESLLSQSEGWIPVEEQMPPEGDFSDLLVTISGCGGLSWVEIGVYTHGVWIGANSDETGSRAPRLEVGDFKVTHWMPLPLPPLPNKEKK